jgi:ankyrin repeat protein
LRMAAKEGHAEAVSLLLEHSADVNAKDGTGKAPLIWAAFQGHADIVKLLLDHGADVDSVDESNSAAAGNTALHFACLKDHIEVVKVLLDHGAQVNLQNCAEYTPLSLASSQEVRQMLKKCGGKAISLSL